MKTKRFLTAVLTAAMLCSMLCIPAVTLAGDSAGSVYFYEDFSDGLGLYTSDLSNAVSHSTELGTGAMKISSPGAGNPAYVYPGSNFFYVKKSTDSGPTKYVLEWRAMIGENFSDNSYIGTYNSTSKGAGTGSESGWLNSSYYKGDGMGAMVSLGSANATEGVAVNKGEWITMTCVYDYTVQSAPSRNLYVNGTLIGNSSNNIYTRTDGQILNNAPFKVYFHGADDTVWIDYVKMYSVPESFTCLGSANETIGTNVFDLKFSSTPASVSAQNFSLGSGNPAVASAERIDADTVRLTTESALTPSSAYTLTISNLTDTLGNTLSSQEVPLQTQSAYTDETILAFDDLDTMPTIEHTYTSTTWSTPFNSNYYNESINNTLESGTSALCLKQNTGSYNANLSTMLALPKYSDTKYTANQRPDVMLEFRSIKDSVHYLKVEPYTLKSLGDVYGFYQNNNKVYDFSTTGNKELLDNVTNATWHTWTIVMSGTENKNTIYVDGVYAGDVQSDSIEVNKWAKDGTIQAVIATYVPNADGYFALDYYKLSEVSDEFSWKVNSGAAANSDTLSLSFNSSVYGLTADQIRINGAAAESVTLTDRRTNTYSVKLPASLAYETEYTLSLNGIKDTTARTITDVYTFTTEDDPTKADVTFVEPANGSILVNGAAADGTKTTYNIGDTVTFTVVPDKGYHTKSVKFGESDLVGNTDGVYTTSELTGDVTITVVFEKNTEEPGVAAAANSAFQENTGDTQTSYSFATVADVSADYNLSEYGMVYSKTVSDPIYNGTDCYTLKSTTALTNNQYGIKIQDNMKLLGGTYYVRPYAVYVPVSGSGENYIAYGEVITITFE